MKPESGKQNRFNLLNEMKLDQPVNSLKLEFNGKEFEFGDIPDK
jgi:hypothetical protein